MHKVALGLGEGKIGFPRFCAQQIKLFEESECELNLTSQASTLRFPGAPYLSQNGIWN